MSCRGLQIYNSRKNCAKVHVIRHLPVVIKIFVLSIWVAVLHRFYCKSKDCLECIAKSGKKRASNTITEPGRGIVSKAAHISALCLVVS